jgi:hypothetical protein
MFACVNCHRPLVRRPPATLYCSAACQQESTYVRYARAVTRDRRINRPDVLEALRIKKAWVLDGGYNPTKELTLSTEVRTVVFERGGSRCVLCGRPATQIDHHRTDERADINDPINLRGLCAECHRTKSLGNLRPINPETEPEAWAKSQELDARVAAPIPLRVSDDEKRWKHLWRSVTKERVASSKAHPGPEQPLQ